MDHYAKTFDIFKKSLTPERRQKELDLLLFSRWRLRTNRDGVQEDYRFRTFKEAFKFMSREAEKMDQQPE
ncbi:hypothetical protein AAVH_25323 [Aphelenchoides avenae]|nr:hypothetical protein AAVH_25323 [Aphelenchus avenae]